MALRDLGDAQLWQLMEDLQQEVAHRELSAYPRGHPLGHWRTPAGGGVPNVENEVTFLGGREWGPSRQQPWPAGPPQIEEDVGCLISTLTTGL